MRWYEDRAAGFGREAEATERTINRLGVARLVVFALAVVCGAWLFSLSSSSTLAAAALVASVALFLLLVALHARARRRATRAQRLRDLNFRGAARVRRDWSALPLPREPIPVNHPYAVDLDVAGTPASLYRLLDVVSEATGRPTVLQWLLNAPPPVEALRERQAAIMELAPAVELREELAVLGEEAGEIGPDRLERFLAWCEGRETPLGAAMRWGAWLVPIVTLVTVALAFVRSVPWIVPGLSFGAGLLLLARARSIIDASLAGVFGRATGLRGQREMLERIAAGNFAAPLLVGLRAESAGGAESLRRLERALSLIDGRGSLTHAIVNTLVLWDVHAVSRLDRWRRQDGAKLRARLAALGSVEALAAFATLAHDNPGWTSPSLQPDAECIVASALAHPLLPAATRVANDVTVGPPGTLLLVTGSNMSGKSTLLRAIGLNVVLAQAGAPVCAASLTMPVVDVHTSIRLADSLERGVSLFMAELQRLKEIVDAARDAQPGRPLLYLLDEILHGTNSAERRIAARAVIGHLVHAGAIGAVTTHDLGLAEDGELAKAAVTVNFTEKVDDGAMSFDYRLRPGLATSTNALRLLKLVGLG